MATRVTFRQWDGGDGMHSKTLNLFDCKESPQEVLRAVYKNHLIYSYKGIHQPVDNNFPNNVEGLMIDELTIEGEHLNSVLSEKGLSLKDINLKKIRSYSDRIGRSPMVFEKTIVYHLKSDLGVKVYYDDPQLPMLKPLSGKNFFLARKDHVIELLKNDKEFIYTKDRNGRENPNAFVPARWIEQQEGIMQTILEIAQVTLENVSTLDDLDPYYKKYEKEKAEVY